MRPLCIGVTDLDAQRENELPLPQHLYSFEGDLDSIEFVRKAATYAKARLNAREWQLALEALRAAHLIMTPGDELDPGLVGGACLMLPLLQPRDGATVVDMAIVHCAGLGGALGSPLTERSRQRFVQLVRIARNYYSDPTAGAAEAEGTAAALNIVREAIPMGQHIHHVMPNEPRRVNLATPTTSHNLRVCALYGALELASALAAMLLENPAP